MLCPDDETIQRSLQQALFPIRVGADGKHYAEVNYTDLANKLGISYSAIKKHIGRLRQTGDIPRTLTIRRTHQR